VTHNTCKELSQTQRSDLAKSSATIESNSRNIVKLKEEMKLAVENTERSLRHEIDDCASKTSELYHEMDGVRAKNSLNVKSKEGSLPTRPSPLNHDSVENKTADVKARETARTTTPCREQDSTQFLSLLCINIMLWRENQELRERLQHNTERTNTVQHVQDKACENFLQSHMVGFEVSEQAIEKSTSSTQANGMETNPKSNAEARATHKEVFVLHSSEIAPDSLETIKTGNRNLSDTDKRLKNKLTKQSKNAKSSNKSHTQIHNDQKYTITQGLRNGQRKLSQKEVTASNESAKDSLGTQAPTTSERTDNNGSARDEAGTTARKALLKIPPLNTQSKSSQNQGPRKPTGNIGQMAGAPEKPTSVPSRSKPVLNQVPKKPTRIISRKSSTSEKTSSKATLLNPRIKDPGCQMKLGSKNHAHRMTLVNS
jgi:hypothetical protein